MNIYPADPQTDRSINRTVFGHPDFVIKNLFTNACAMYYHSFHHQNFGGILALKK